MRLLVGNQLVLAGLATGYGFAYNPVGYMNEINNAMDVLSAKYQETNYYHLQEFSFSEWQTINNNN